MKERDSTRPLRMVAEAAKPRSKRKHKYGKELPRRHTRVRFIYERVLKPLVHELDVLRHFLTQVRKILSDGSGAKAQHRRLVRLLESIHGHEEGPGTWRRLSKRAPRETLTEAKPEEIRPGGSANFVPAREARREAELLARYGSGMQPFLLPGDWEQL